MKQAVIALRALIADVLGLEGAFLAFGTILLAVAALLTFGTAAAVAAVGIVLLMLGVVITVVSIPRQEESDAKPGQIHSKR